MKDTKFKRGQTPWNKGIKKELNVEYIKREYLSGKSTIDLGKEFNVSDRTIANRLRRIGIELRKKHSKETITKIRDTLKRKGIQPKQRYSGEVWNKGLTEEDERVKNNIRGLKEARKFQVLPFRDSKPELKIQSFLRQLDISFVLHKYINIKHGYQCDIFIPSLNIIIECDGDYWHFNPIKYKEEDFRYVRKKKVTAKERWELDRIRTEELIQRGFKVIRIWESTINKINLEDFKSILSVTNY